MNTGIAPGVWSIASGRSSNHAITCRYTENKRELLALNEVAHPWADRQDHPVGVDSPVVRSDPHPAPRWLHRKHALLAPNLSAEASGDRELCLHAALRADKAGGGLEVGRTHRHRARTAESGPRRRRR